MGVHGSACTCEGCADTGDTHFVNPFGRFPFASGLFGRETRCKIQDVTPSIERRSLKLRVPALLLLLTFVAVLIHGYHVGVEDQEVYLAAIKKNLDPSLYPFNSVFFTEQMKVSLFVPAVAASIRVMHSDEWALLLWHLGSIFLILLGCWKVASHCFSEERERWAGVLLVAVLLTLPLAGTALYPVDQYLHPRAPAAGASLMAIAAALEKRWGRAVLWTLVSTAMHPLMAMFGASLTLFVAWPSSAVPRWREAAAAFLPLDLLKEPSDAWKEATHARTYYFPTQWQWYEWLGLVAPVAMLWWFSDIARRRGLKNLEHLASRSFAFAIFQFVIAAAMTIPASRQTASLQPMRWLHILYFVFLLIAGGLAARYIFPRRLWVGATVLAGLAGTMFFVQLDLFRYSDHIELPGQTVKNPWANAFLWARGNTPKDAVFATVPKYMDLHAEDAYGFRALSERSMLAENQKDPGAATVFPELAPVWQQQVHSQQGIENFNRAQFSDLGRRWGASWVVLPVTAKVELDCPYTNQAAKVCKLQ